jgi:RHS repeat-associated protein
MNVASATRATFIPDIQGSFIGTLDATSGSLTKFGYQTYGESGSPNSSFGYTGQRIDPETNGLYYYRARMYSPVWGRFLQVDAIGYAGGSNLYAYVNNDPLNFFDPLGLAQDSPLTNLVSTAFQPYVNFYETYAVQPLQTTLQYAAWLSGPSSPVGTAPGGGLAWAAPELGGLSGGLSALAGTLGAGAEAAEETTTLFRAVGPSELSSLESGAGYTASPGGLESKYFYPTAQQASNFAANPANAQFGPFTLTSANVPNSLIASENTVSVLGEGSVVTIPNELLPKIPQPTISNMMPLSTGTP